MPSRSGFTLLGVLITAAICSLLVAGLISIMSLLFRSNKHAQLSSDSTLLRTSLTQLIDCDNTWTANSVSVVSDCLPSANPKALLLKTRKNANVTSALSPVTGLFNPIDKTTQGSGTLGDTLLRAYCDSTQNTLVVRYAKFGSSGGFFQDPLTKRVLDWGNSPSNPVLGQPTSIMCAEKFGGACTGPLRVVTGQNKNTSPTATPPTCSGTKKGDNLCDGTISSYIPFSPPFNCPPQVIVSPAYLCDASYSPCSGGATDTVYVEAQNVTTAGFTMYCNGSPTSGGGCGALSVYHCAGLCNWMAVGN